LHIHHWQAPHLIVSHNFHRIKAISQVRIKVSCLNGSGIDNLKNRLEKLIPKAELFNTSIDERWIEIKESLQKETKSNHFLDEKRFFQICLDYNLTEKRPQQNAIKFLHDLGLVLHFESVHLSEYYVLDPYWITYGVYQILTSKYAGELEGIVGMDNLDFIINEEEDKRQVYRSSNYVKINYYASPRECTS
jgi:internalin A